MLSKSSASDFPKYVQILLALSKVDSRWVWDSVGVSIVNILENRDRILGFSPFILLYCNL